MSPGAGAPRSASSDTHELRHRYIDCFFLERSSVFRGEAWRKPTEVLESVAGSRWWRHSEAFEAWRSATSLAGVSRTHWRRRSLVQGERQQLVVGCR